MQQKMSEKSMLRRLLERGSARTPKFRLEDRRLTVGASVSLSHVATPGLIFQDHGLALHDELKRLRASIEESGEDDNAVNEMLDCSSTKIVGASFNKNYEFDRACGRPDAFVRLSNKTNFNSAEIPGCVSEHVDVTGDAGCWRSALRIPMDDKDHQCTAVDSRRDERAVDAPQATIAFREHSLRPHRRGSPVPPSTSPHPHEIAEMPSGHGPMLPLPEVLADFDSENDIPCCKASVSSGRQEFNNSWAKL